MSISDKVRKQLWASSGSKCAICKEELFPVNADGKTFNIGEECHIISKTPNGPRHIPNYGDYDSYENLLLLCPKHHKEIDDSSNVAQYPVQYLRQIKSEHENWVRERLKPKKENSDKEWKEILKKLDLVNPI